MFSRRVIDPSKSPTRGGACAVSVWPYRVPCINHSTYTGVIAARDTLDSSTRHDGPRHELPAVERGRVCNLDTAPPSPFASGRASAKLTALRCATAAFLQRPHHELKRESCPEDWPALCPSSCLRGDSTGPDPTCCTL